MPPCHPYLLLKSRALPANRSFPRKKGPSTQRASPEASPNRGARWRLQGGLAAGHSTPDISSRLSSFFRDERLDRFGLSPQGSLENGRRLGQKFGCIAEHEKGRPLADIESGQTLGRLDIPFRRSVARMLAKGERRAKREKKKKKRDERFGYGFPLASIHMTKLFPQSRSMTLTNENKQQPRPSHKDCRWFATTPPLPSKHRSFLRYYSSA